MREPWTQLFVHLVWATWNRAPLLTPWIHTQVDACIRRECVKLRVEVLAFGGVEDHVHLLARFPTTISIAQLTKQLKGVSSHMVEKKLDVPFRWQGGYGAFSLSKRHVPRITQYVLNQEEHHRENRIFLPLELPRD
jgi:REP element-mobilizing transposase RayT